MLSPFISITVFSLIVSICVKLKQFAGDTAMFGLASSPLDQSAHSSTSVVTKSVVVFKLSLSLQRFSAGR